MIKKVKYPGQAKRSYKKPKVKASYANRGKAFEMLIIETNKLYQMKNWAHVEKVEPIIQITQEIPPNKVVGFKRGKGFVDFFGCCNGRALAFEAKKTTSRTSFPLKNIGENQMNTLRNWNDQGGISFFLIQFEKLHEIYFVKYEQVEKWWIDSKRGGRQSIPYTFFHLECELVKTQRGVPCDYLACI